MQIRHFSSILALALATVPQVAAGKAPTVLSPMGPWTVDYAEERCSLIRRFGDDEKSLVLQIDSYGSPHQFRALVFGDYVPASNRPTGKISYKFTPDREYRQDQRAIFGKSGISNATSFLTAFSPNDISQKEYLKLSEEEVSRRMENLPKVRAEFEDATNSMTLRLVTLKEIELRLGNMVKPLAALRGCVDDLYNSWGLDPQPQHTRKRTPIPDTRSVRNVMQNYPTQMALGGKSAFLSVRVMVNEQGEAGSCIVQNENVDKAFTDAVCAGLARHFEPALDAEGKPMSSFYQTIVTYLID
ncbi:hypothetical protein H0274_06915 [Altererythrobacter sp. CC-YST694]|uniref:hypothetical protein n=1 Tax=Altererythrobacter sp. CC-YST694 TaxID=2755038 RepID=UPI001D00667E|nr:hypothetical protein [Altererythrobacter sp. CC-YST694]MCB5424980.1 hypothetical protein [Altererythrobacter sp. CC-YST694]